MADDLRLAELLERWEELRHQGHEVDVGDLCHDCPELADALRDRIRALQAMDWLLESDSSASDGDGGDGDWPTPPGKLGRYELRRFIGRGGYGQVWLGYDPELNRQVAVKVPRPDRLGAPHDFLEEARKVAQLRHPGIVPVHDVGTEGEWCFIVSDFIDGGNLAQRFTDQPLSWQNATRLVAEIAHTLDYAHRQGFIHRDIKPSNILLDCDGKPYLADFGIAITDEELEIGDVGTAGTLAFMSPEQLRGLSHSLDGRTDIYSLSVVLYWLLAGKMPFRGQSEMNLREAVLHGEPKPLRMVDGSMPAELERICFKAMAKQPSSRFSTARDFAEALLNLAEPTWRWRRTAWTASGVGVLLVLLATGLLRMNGGEDQSEVPSAGGRTEPVELSEPVVQQADPTPDVRELEAKEMTGEELVEKLRDYAASQPLRRVESDDTPQRIFREATEDAATATGEALRRFREKAGDVATEHALPIPDFRGLLPKRSNSGGSEDGSRQPDGGRDQTRRGL
ncbi:MAG: serine/threonine-protein kinase [Thermoguttaceae bacterium]|jgi:hypothetical protein|nr:serine/threonine-protein kinase [Thermoguttaceae bacterium]